VWEGGGGGGVGGGVGVWVCSGRTQIGKRFEQTQNKKKKKGGDKEGTCSKRRVALQKKNTCQ